MDRNQSEIFEAFLQKKAHMLKLIAAETETRRAGEAKIAEQQAQLKALDEEIAYIKASTPHVDVDMMRRDAEKWRRLAATASAAVQQHNVMEQKDAANRAGAWAKKKEKLDDVDKVFAVAQSPDQRANYEAELAWQLERVRIALTESEEMYANILAETERVQAEKRRKKELTDTLLANVTTRLDDARKRRDQKRAELAAIKEKNDRNRFTMKLLTDTFAKMNLPKNNK